MSQHKYNVYAFGTRKSRHMSARSSREINRTIYAASMQKAADTTLAELAGYEIERLDIDRVRPEGEVVEIGVDEVGRNEIHTVSGRLDSSDLLAKEDRARQIALYTPTLGTDNIASPMIVTDNVVAPEPGFFDYQTDDVFTIDSERRQQAEEIAAREMGEKAA